MKETWRLFFALGDPYRIEILRRLAANGPSALFQLGEGFPFSRQAVAKQVGVLADVGLVRVQKQGRAKIVTLEPENFHLARLFLTQMEGQWDDRLDRLKFLAEGIDHENG